MRILQRKSQELRRACVHSIGSAVRYFAAFSSRSLTSFMSLVSSPLSDYRTSAKADIITKHLENGYNVQHLRFWSLSRYGLVNDSIRKGVWPILSGLTAGNNINPYGKLSLQTGLL